MQKRVFKNYPSSSTFANTLNRESKHDKPTPCNGRPSMLDVINSYTSKLPSSSSCHTVSDPLSPSVVATHVGHLNTVASSLPSDLSIVVDQVDLQSLPVPVQFEIEGRHTSEVEPDLSPIRPNHMDIQSTPESAQYSPHSCQIKLLLQFLSILLTCK